MWAPKGSWAIETYDRFLDIEDIPEENPVLYDPLDPADNAPPVIGFVRLGNTEKPTDP